MHSLRRARAPRPAAAAAAALWRLGGVTGVVARLALVTTGLRAAAAQYCPPGAATICDSVLVIHAYEPFAVDVQSRLRGTGTFATVDLFNANSGTPSAGFLAGYDAVLAYSNVYFADPVLLGDRLAAYHDQGGGVVVANDANDNNGVHNDARLQGAYGAVGGGYALLDYAQGSSTDPVADSLGDVLEQQSPLMAGVASLAVQDGRSTAPVIAGRGAVVVARWRGGGQEPLVVRGARGNRTLVELNIFPPVCTTGDGVALLRNALKYSRCMPCGAGTYAAAGAGVQKEGKAGKVRCERWGAKHAKIWKGGLSLPAPTPSAFAMLGLLARHGIVVVAQGGT